MITKYNKLLLSLVTFGAALPSLAQTFSFDGRLKDAVQVKADDKYSDAKGYGYDFQDVVAEARTMQNDTYKLSDGIFYFSVSVPDGNYRV